MFDIEKSFSRLEEINDQIRDPQMSLTKATELFEEGIKLSEGIEKALNKVEQKIEILTNPPGDTINEPGFELFSSEN